MIGSASLIYANVRTGDKAVRAKKLPVILMLCVGDRQG